MKFDMKKFEVPFANIFTSSNTDIRDIGGGIFKNTDIRDIGGGIFKNTDIRDIGGGIFKNTDKKKGV